MKTILIIAGSDSGGGAGIQADIKTACAHGVFATTAITALTAQNTHGVSAIQDISAEFLGKQIEAVLEDFKIDAIKIGMLNNAKIIEVVAEKLQKVSCPVILDTVMISSSGHKLLDEDAISALQNKLIPLATLITPNIPEAEALTEMKISSVQDMKLAAEKLTLPVLIKGGHLESEELVDILFTEEKTIETKNSKLKTQNTHGTGCTLSSAIACNLANGVALEGAVENAIKYVRRAIESAPNIGSGVNKPLSF